MRGHVITSLVCLMFAIFTTGQSAIVHESTFSSAAGTNPLTTNDVTWIWSVDKNFTGGSFGHYVYTGAGQLNLVSPAHNWDDPYMELDTSSVLGVSEDLEVILDCLPLVTADTSNQGIVVAMTDPVTSPSVQTNWATTGEVAVILTSTRGVIRAVFTDNPGSFNAGSLFSQAAAIAIPAASLTNLRVILTYDSATTTYKAYLQANSGDILEFPASYNITRTKTVVNITSNMYFGSLEEAFTTQLDNLSIGDAITVTEGDAFLAVQERIFNALPVSNADPFWPITVGDLNGMFKGSSLTYDYNGAGQLVVEQIAGNTANSNAIVNLQTDGSTPETQLVIDIRPGFTNDGVLQMFNVRLVGDWSIQIANAEGAGQGVGIFWWQDNIFALDPADAAKINFPASGIDHIRLIATYDEASDEVELFYSVNEGAVYRHPNSPQTYVRAATQLEFQWQVWSSTNPSPFIVSLDNVAEFNQITQLDAPILTSVSAPWDLYQ